MIDINAWEAVIILLLAFVLIGPERLPEYAARLGRWVRRAKRLADNARGQLREQMGPEFDDIDWKAYDLRQYDPRRIVRDALAEGEPNPPVDGDLLTPQATPAPAGRHDPTLPTPYDPDAT